MSAESEAPPASGDARGTVAKRAPSRPFVGRHKELEQLRAALEEAISGNGSLVLVAGEAGIGKTRLAQELAAVATERGCRVLSGRCWEEGGAPAYWPWIEVVRRAGGDFERLARSPTEGTVDPETERFRLFDSATSFLVAAAREQPVLIGIDDLHAADASSLLLLRFMSEAIASERVLIVGSYRHQDPRVQANAQRFAGLVRSGRRIALRGLTPRDVADYVDALTGEEPDAALVERVHRITGGNAFFLSEVVQALAVEGGLRLPATDAPDLPLPVPEEVRALIRHRVEGLSAQAIAVLRLAAVAGREFDLRIIQLTSELGAPRLLEGLDEAVGAGLLVRDPVTPQRFAFVHELVRKTLYDDLPAANRLDLHRTIGRRLEALHRRDLDPHLSSIAHHLAAAAPLGDVPEALDYLVRAGDHAASLFAYEEAALNYRRALELIEPTEADAARRCELCLALGNAAWRAGDGRSARASFEEAARLARRLDAPELFARAALGYVTALGGFLLFARFEVGDTAAGLLEEALEWLPADDSPLRARILARLAVEMASANELVDRRLRLSGEAISTARRLGDSEALVTGLHARHWALATPDLVLERLANSEEMLRVARDIGSREMAFLAHNARFDAALERCDGDGIGVETEAMAQVAEDLRQPLHRWHVVCLRVVRATLDGRFVDAEELANEALRLGQSHFSEYAGYVFGYAQIVAIRWAQGRLEELRAVLAPHGERYPWVPRWRDALTAAEFEDEEAARVELERHGGAGFADLSRDGLWLLHVCALAECAVLIGDERRGAQLHELLRPYAERNAVSYTLQPFGPVALRLGMLARVLGRWEEAERQFETAARCCERLGAPAVCARVALEYARTLIARGERDDRVRAGELVSEGARLAGDLDAPGLLARISALASELEPATREARASADGEIVFRREGEFWTVGYRGGIFRLRDLKGLRYIAVLAAAPGRELHALELVGAVEGHSPRPAAGPAGSEPAPSWLGGAGPILDPQAKDEYRRRLADLEEELEDARGWGDGERAASAREEIDFLTRELAAAVGLGGRDREAVSPAERARVSVTKAIKTAIRAVERESPELAEHLTASIRTGRFCRYAPPGEEPPRWMLH